MGIGRDTQRRGACHLDQPPQEAPGGVFVPVLAQSGVEEGTISVGGAVEVTPATGNLYVGLIDVPGDPGAASAIGPQLVRKQRREAELQFRIVSWVTASPRWSGSSTTSRKLSL